MALNHKSLHDVFSQANICTSKLMQDLKAQAEGNEGLWCNIRDMYNFEKDRKEENRAHDGQMFI